MKRLLTICLLIGFALPLAAVEDEQVMYLGGTGPSLHAGVVGHLDTTSEAALIFDYSGTKLHIPYAAIESFAYSKEVSHHLGVMPAIAVGLLKMRQHSHYFRISYLGADAVSQVVVFEIPKQMPRTLEAVLQARAPQSCKPVVP